ncbi:MAG: isoleucine--tRNA ligase [Alphaproteobacteria bacterium]|nr:isoleucine--tRNA ligase [Alphaproteobacteria bacterium]
MTTDAVAPAREYKDTLFLPDTDFPMKAGLPKAEPEWLTWWDKIGFYKRLREAAKGRPKFIFHDGPPYANGNIHLGTGMNKILKDFVVRSQGMLGKDVPYIHGWDCHGLPIEWKVEEKYRKEGKDKDQVPLIEFRKECRDFANHWLNVQRGEFKRLGATGEWDNPYVTMAPASEAIIIREIQKFVMNGALYRGSKPVMWSVVEKTALAEAEVEYHEKLSPTIFVKFPIKSGASGDLAKAKIVIWTTTPWTIPGNRAICYSPKISYGLFRVTAVGEGAGATAGDLLVLADTLAETAKNAAKIEAWDRIADADPAGLVCAHPFAGQGYDFPVPLFAGEHVTDDTGTGFVHTAPGHGEEDFDIWMQHPEAHPKDGPKIPFTVSEDGSFYPHVPIFAGKKILTAEGKDGDANGAVIGELIKANALLAKGKLRHDYPHSWRSKAPVIFRNTPQWFIAMDKPIANLGGRTLRELALKAIDDTHFVPEQGRNRLRAMVEKRPDWVISRQRAWGVPIPIFMRKDNNEILRDTDVNERVAAAVEKGGTDVWFTTDVQEFLGNKYKADDYTRVDDIIDVWFESGSTHAFVIEKEHGWPADLYLEGSDQHRGWFQSSLLEACGTRGRAPYKTVLTHGFVLDEKGYKQSKSLGNTVEPQKVAEQNGIEIMRIWAASSDFTEDLRLGPEILKANVESYRKLRNTMRYILANLMEWKESERVAAKDMPELERWVLHRLTELDAIVRAGYAAFDFNRVFTAVFNFCTTDLSAIYFDIRKDTLYCDANSSLRRRAARTVLDHLFNHLTAWLAPVMVFTMEEVWRTRNKGEHDSVHLRTFPAVPVEWHDKALAEKWARLRDLRRVVTGALEVARREKTIGASLEAAPAVHVTDIKDADLLKSLDLAEIAITSAVQVTTAAAPAGAFKLDDVPGIAVAFAKAPGTKCARCWRILPEVGKSSAHPHICLRCEAAVAEHDAK